MSIIDLYDLFIHNPQITTDSRNCPKGSIFFALKGDKFDGNQYAGKALASGCVYAVIDNPDYYIGERTILVDNVLKTLQQLAHHHRKVLGVADHRDYRNEWQDHDQRVIGRRALNEIQFTIYRREFQ